MTRLLIVDDEPANARALVESLQDENSSWEFQTATNYSEAIASITNGLSNGMPIDVVVTDLFLESPRCGLRVLKEAVRLDPRLVVIVVTALPPKETGLDRAEAFQYGAFDVIERVLLGKTAAHEVNVKTRIAVRFRKAIERAGFLQRYFDPKLFEAIESDPTVLQLRQRTLTICFWDIRGFSLLCEILKAQPTLIAGFLEEYCAAAAKCVFQHGGVLDKFIGDGVMALFGAIGRGDAEGKASAVSAVKAAFAFRREFRTLVGKWTETWHVKGKIAQQIDIGIGCGIHTGDVLAGNVGTSFRDQFTALGPDVNLAARIESRSRSGQILLSKSTESRVNVDIKTVPAGTINDIKNIPGVYELFEAHPIE